jgi:AbiV family abortive infection protein
MKDLEKLNKEEYEIGAITSLKNAKDLYDSSTEIALKGRFGTATSLLILASEELVKASVLKLKSIDSLKKIENFAKYFSKHSVKHESLEKIFIASLGYLDDYQLNEVSSVEEQCENSRTKWICALVFVMIMGIIIYILTSNKTNTKDTKLNSTFESQRTAGFYVDFDFNNRKWKSPSDISDEKKYNELKDSIEMIFNTIKKTLFKNKINSKNISEFLSILENK